MQDKAKLDVKEIKLYEKLCNRINHSTVDRELWRINNLSLRAQPWVRLVVHGHKSLSTLVYVRILHSDLV